MIRRGQALAAGAGLFGISLLGMPFLALVILAFIPGFGLGLVFLLPAPLLLIRKLTGLARRCTQRWAGVSIATPYALEPAPPVQQADGWYQRDRKLYRRPTIPAWMNRFEWILGDNATWRDLLWLALAPITGGLIGALPAALIVSPFVLGPWWTVAAIAGFLLSPLALRLSAHFNKRLLGGPIFTGVSEHPVRDWFGWAIVPVLRLGVLLLTSIVAIPVFVATLLGLLLGYGLGLFFLVPVVLQDLRWLADWRRSLAVWSGLSIPTPYRPLPNLNPRREDGLYQVGKNLYKTRRWASWAQRWEWTTRDPATWREVLWRGVDPFVGGVIAGIPVLLIGYGIWGLAIPRVVQTFVNSNSGDWYGHIAGYAWPALPAGLLMAWLGIAVTPRALKLHGRWTRVLLGPTAETVLAQRVEQLTVTRAEAQSAAAAELRRIERDLHDGAQARLVALGLSLAAAERLIDKDPAAAKTLVGKARNAAGTALQELREVMRGIHPPVLAERGLVDAVRALALDSPVSATVTAPNMPRLPDPIEAAAYFTVAEALGNAARHGGASTVNILLEQRDGLLRIVVRDDGRGGADPARGSGLRGLARRLGIFDGTVAISSPPGGPTELIVEVPCESSWPRISSSSERA